MARPGIVLGILALVALPSCAHVAPYERERLAHPTMTTSELAGPAETHVRSVQEGAIGGSLGDYSRNFLRAENAPGAPTSRHCKAVHMATFDSLTNPHQRY